MGRPYTITIDTDYPAMFDLLAQAPGNWEATMQEHHPRTNAVVNTWYRSHQERGGSLSDPDDVGMVVVEEPKPQDLPDETPRRERGPDWQHENPDEETNLAKGTPAFCGECRRKKPATLHQMVSGEAVYLCRGCE